MKKNRFKTFLETNKNFILVFILCAVLSSVFFSLIIPKAEPLMSSPKNDTINILGDNFSIVALGDSLTEGIGDDANSEGYLPLVKKGLELKYNASNLNTHNFGKKGNRTPQLTKRIQESKDIQTQISSANIILITIGGNDLVKAVKDNLFTNLSVDSFQGPEKEYVAELELLYSTIRKYNNQAPIYHLGIYNPFYLNFPEITALQEIVNNWNMATEIFTNTQHNSLFIPINDLIYQGDGFNLESETVNGFLSEEDSFHPNSLGYQIIASEFTKKIIETHYLWQKEE